MRNALFQFAHEAVSSCLTRCGTAGVIDASERLGERSGVLPDVVPAATGSDSMARLAALDAAALL